MKRRNFLAMVGLAPVVGGMLSKIPAATPPTIQGITVPVTWISETSPINYKLFDAMMKARRLAENQLRQATLDKMIFGGPLYDPIKIKGRRHRKGIKPINLQSSFQERLRGFHAS